MSRYYHAGGAYDPYVVVPTKAEAERDDRECKRPSPAKAHDFDPWDPEPGLRRVLGPLPGDEDRPF